MPAFLLGNRVGGELNSEREEYLAGIRHSPSSFIIFKHAIYHLL